MKKILVTGYKGMIGSAMYSYLNKFNDYNVKGIDLVDNSGDIITYKNTEDFDIIIHCAALASVIESIKKPKEYYRVNVLGTYNLLREHPFSKFIFLSTSAVYGEGLNHKETDHLNPISPYASTKLESEGDVSRMTLDYTILRLSNVFGGKKKERGVHQIFEEESELTIYGDGSALRDYLHVNNLCKIIHRCFNKKGLYNIGSGKFSTVLDIAKSFNKPIIFKPERPGEIKALTMDLSKAKKVNIL